MKRIYKQLFTFWLFVLICPSVFSQDRTEIDTLALKYDQKLNFDIYVRPKYFGSISEQKISLMNSSFNFSQFVPSFKYDSYKLPPIPELTINQNFNFLHQNYDNYKFYNLSRNTSLLLNNSHNMYVGLGAISSLSAGLSFQPDERWNITVNGSAMRYVDFSGLKNDFTVGAHSRFAITDRLGINAFGSYAVNQMRNANFNSMLMSPFAPKSYYGGTLDFRITDHFGIEGGVKYEFNPFSRKWERQYILTPKFY